MNTYSSCCNIIYCDMMHCVSFSHENENNKENEKLIKVRNRPR